MPNELASISHGGKVFRFRTNPNSIRWTYKINTAVTPTYGGKVVQLLSVNIDDLIIKADAGGGGWDYLYTAATFFRDMLFDQRGGGEPGVFSYPPRGWEMSVYALNFPFRDDNLAVLREFEMRFKVQEDISGVISADLKETEIARLQEGIGWKHNDYNTPPAAPPPVDNPAAPADPAAPTTDTPPANVGEWTPSPPSTGGRDEGGFIPNPIPPPSFP